MLIIGAAVSEVFHIFVEKCDSTCLLRSKKLNLHFVWAGLFLVWEKKICFPTFPTQDKL